MSLVAIWRRLTQNGCMDGMRANSDWIAPLKSLFAGFGCFFLGSLSDVWLQRHAGSVSVAILDDALIGIGVGLLVLLYERRQRQSLIRKIEVIRLMNHHVRNSLQVISFATSAPQHEELTIKVRNAVERIEWALREVLPGQRNVADLSLDPSLLHTKDRP